MYKKLKQPIVCIFVGFLLGEEILGAIYNVGPSKNYKQLSEITNLLKPGDTVLVDGDAEYKGDVTFRKSGALQNKIVIKGIIINGKRPHIKGGTNTVAFISEWPYKSGADHYIFEGFEISGGTSRGIYHQADDLIIRDCIVHDCPKQGILGADQGAGSCVIEFCEIYNCGSGSSNHQIYMSTDQVNHPGSVFRLQYCYIHDATGGNNLKSRAERNEIYYNWIEGAYYHELELIGPDPGGVADEWTPHLKREDSDVVGNVLFKRKTSANNDPNFSVVRFGGDGTGESHGRYRFVNNTVICGSGAVFRLFDSLESLEAHNNVFYRIDGGANLTRMVEANWTTGKPVIFGTNNWVVEGSTNIPSDWSGTIKGKNSPFVNIERNNLRPSNGSSLINAGNSTPTSKEGFEFPFPLPLPQYEPPERQKCESPKNRPQKATIDIGAYSFESGTVSHNQHISNKRILFKTFLRNKKLTYMSTQKIVGKLNIAVFTLEGKIIFCQSKEYAVPSYVYGIIELNDLPPSLVGLRIISGNHIYKKKYFLFKF